MKLKILIEILFIFIGIAIPLTGNSQTTVFVDPSQITITNTNTVTINVMISNVTNLRAYSVSINFNDSVILLTQALSGGFLATGGGTFFGTQPSVSNVLDNITVDEAILGTNSVSGSGKLFSLTFTLLEPGTSPITIEYVELKDPNNNTISCDIASGQVEVMLSLNAKIFLQGPFSGNEMVTTLNSSGILPLSQPFNTPPWNYSGTENVANIPNNVVDWVLVEIRTDISSSTKTITGAGFLKNDGLITNLDGLTPLSFPIAKDEYYVVIYPRNHLPIMSSNNISLDVISGLYDFSISSSQAYGNNSMKEISSGVYGLWCGDANADGAINALDRNVTWNFRNLTGYLIEDVNMDGAVNALDRNITWNNRNLTSQVP